MTQEIAKRNKGGRPRTVPPLTAEDLARVRGWVEGENASGRECARRLGLSYTHFRRQLAAIGYAVDAAYYLKAVTAES